MNCFEKFHVNKYNLFYFMLFLKKKFISNFFPLTVYMSPIEDIVNNEVG
jgi:hypothetical protein